jgi:GT2 family glycosyltransferase
MAFSKVINFVAASASDRTHSGQLYCIGKKPIGIAGWSNENKEAGIIQSMLLLASERALTNNAGNALHYLGFGFIKHYRERVDAWYHRGPFEIGYASGAAMLIKREVIEKLSPPARGGVGVVGVLDEKFYMYHEDLDLCWRARLAGYKIMIAPQAIVYHHYEFHRNKKMVYWSERNRWAALLQNYSLKTLCLLMPLLLAIEVGVLLYSLFHGWLWQKIKSYIWLLARLLPILRQRRRVQSMRTVGDKEIMQHMESKLEFAEVKNPVLKYIVSPITEKYYKLVVS